MSTSPIQSGNPFQELSRLFAQTADGNRDGQVSQDEFAAFLATLLQSLSNPSNQAASAPTGTNSLPTRSVALPSFTTLPMASESNRPHMSGFSATKLADSTHDSPKYIFGRLAQNLDLSSVVDKASAEALLRQMRPELEAAGMTILDVRKDSIQIPDDHGNPVWVDVIWGSESGRPAFQWLVHSSSGSENATATTATGRDGAARSQNGDGDRARVRS
jgi:hypothetical protein